MELNKSQLKQTIRLLHAALPKAGTPDNEKEIRKQIKFYVKQLKKLEK